MNKKSPTVAGLFVGCGGLDFGFQQAGFQLAWANEINSDAALSYSKLTGHEVVVDDIWNVLKKIPAVDILIGGPPCQSFSLVGKRIEDDPRGRLVFAYLEAIKKARPFGFVIENVPGLMASEIDGKKLHLILAEKLEKLGYVVTILKLWASDYFVPQKRQRVLMIGHKPVKKSFVLPDTKEFLSALQVKGMVCPVTAVQALGDLPPVLAKGDYSISKYVKETKSAYANLMRDIKSGGVTMHSMPTMSDLDMAFVKYIPPGGNYMNIPDKLSTIRIMKFKESGGRTTTYGRLHPDKPAYTINTYFNRPNVGANYHYLEDRLITVREALRLQSFPDRFTPFFSNQRSLHAQIGNAVPPLLARAIAEGMIKLFT